MKIMKTIILLFLTTISCFSFERYILKADQRVLDKSREIMLAQKGVTEATNNNDGVMVNKYQKAVGIRQGTAKVKGDPYCAGGQYFCFAEAVNYYKLPISYIPIPRTGSSQVPFDFAKKNGKKTSMYPQVDDLMVWKQKTAYQGHIGRVTEVRPKGWLTVGEFNTSPNSKGSQRDGGGFYMKSRNYLHPLGAMLVRGFIGFNR